MVLAKQMILHFAAQEHLRPRQRQRQNQFPRLDQDGFFEGQT